MPTSSFIRVSQPCAESWDAMTPAATGRHCAACQKTVVDFTQKTDAEILAYFRQVGERKGCGRFRAAQLTQPLALSDAANTSRWRTWLAALTAVCGLRLGARQEAQAQLAKPLIAVSTTSAPTAAAVPAPGTSLLITGVVLDSAAHEKLPGATVILQGTTLGTSSDANGQFSLTIRPDEWQKSKQALAVSSVGYQTQVIPVLSTNPAPVEVLLAVDNHVLGESIVVGGYVSSPKPWPWHPRRLYYWSKYQLMRPFRR